MTGFLDHLAARITPDRTRVRPRADALLLTQLQSSTSAAGDPNAENDDYAAPAPARPRRAIHPSPPPSTAEQPFADTAAKTVPPLRPPTADRLAVERMRPAPQPPPTSQPDAERRDISTSFAPAAAVPAAAAQPVAAAETRRSRPATAAAVAGRPRPLTSRPTSAPATPPAVRHTPIPAPSPMAIITRPDQAGARRDAPRTQTKPEQPPPVEITIDRIDVRLQSTSQPPQPPRTGPREPMSLQRYLESREQSRRTP